MSIPLKEPTMSADPLPDWFFPPPEGWTADDLDRLPPSAPSHIELIDGALIVTAPQRSFHARTLLRLGAALDLQAPEGVGVEPEMTVRLGERQRPEPDLVVFRDTDGGNGDRTYHLPEDVLLVVEVVSPNRRSATARPSRSSTPRRGSRTSGWSRRRKAPPPCTSTNWTGSTASIPGRPWPGGAWS
ncbi:Uma2 family endonuclease [Nocardiopsis potens]|uniref:Uma2 family endonuclease n=1 Tax=Nocardiopsis potens TaxID=1246458 RepID=UPI0030844B5F